jgi:pre-mRNA-splicing factor SYF1
MPIALEIGMKYAKMERKLGEIDRARALYMYLSQMCNPSSNEMKERFWKVWEQFEIVHGSEDTYKNFLKIERSISYKFSVVPTIEDKKSIVDSKK